MSLGVHGLQVLGPLMGSPPLPHGTVVNLCRSWVCRWPNIEVTYKGDKVPSEFPISVLVDMMYKACPHRHSHVYIQDRYTIPLYTRIKSYIYIYIYTPHTHTHNLPHTPLYTLSYTPTCTDAHPFTPSLSLTPTHLHTNIPLHPLLHTHLHTHPGEDHHLSGGATGRTSSASVSASLPRSTSNPPRDPALAFSRFPCIGKISCIESPHVYM